MIVSQLMATGCQSFNAQAIAGLGAAALTAVGNNQATALQLPASNNQISTALAATGARLPKGEAGNEVWVRNDGANPVLVYPFEAAGVTIGGAASFSVTNGKTAIFKAITDTYWAPFLSA
jgi:hypothetical protein